MSWASMARRFGCGRPISPAGRLGLDPIFLLNNFIWPNFAPLKAVRALDGTKLTYYQNWTPTNFQYYDLVKSGDGQCGSWARLLAAAMLADGLDQATGWTIKLDTITAMQGISGFLANNWSFAIPNGVNTNWVYAKVNPTNNNIWTPNILNQDYNWVPDQIMQATKTDGVPGQNVPNPLALFGNHQIIELDENVPGQPAQVILFDPS